MQFTALTISILAAIRFTVGAVVRDLSVPTDAPSGAPAPPQFNITSLGLNGSGCPPGSGFYLLSADKTAVTVTFSQFEASAGPGIVITEGRKNCQITLGVHVPQGFSFAVVNVDYRGYIELDAKVKGIRTNAYYFQGQLVQGNAGSTQTGVVLGNNYVIRDSFNLTPTVYSPCGQDTVLNINSAVRIDNSANTKGYGFMTDDSIDTSIIQTFNFQWLTC